MKRENQLTNLGTFVFAFGALAFLPSLFDRELLILAWLGQWQQPVGIMAIAVGGLVWGAGKLALIRDAPPPDVGVPAVPDAGPSATSAPTSVAAPQPNVLTGQVEPSERR